MMVASTVASYTWRMLEFGDVGIKCPEDIVEAWRLYGLDGTDLEWQLAAMSERWGEQDALAMIAEAIKLLLDPTRADG